MFVSVNLGSYTITTYLLFRDLAETNAMYKKLIILFFSIVLADLKVEFQNYQRQKLWQEVYWLGRTLVK
jgi:hypothetical protein